MLAAGLDDEVKNYGGGTEDNRYNYFANTKYPEERRKIRCHIKEKMN